MRTEVKENSPKSFSHPEVEAILASLNTGVAKLDAIYNINYANAAFSKITGYKTGELFNKNFSLLLTPDADNIADIFSQTDQQTQQSLLINLQKQNGVIAVCRIRITRLVNDDTNSCFIILAEEINHTITEEKEMAYRRQLARTVMDTQESERRKLAEELHDNVNQLLGVVKLYIEHSITNDNIREGLLRKSNEYIDKAIAELRTLSKNLAPPLLKELGLEHSVNSLADVIAGVQDINITVDMMDFDEDGLTESHMLMLYRIVQEQLNNITKHSKAKNAGITIRKTDSKVQLIINDDGIGVDLSAADNAEGMGLRNIRNRIELYQGKIDMITSPGNGFILKVEFEI